MGPVAADHHGGGVLGSEAHDPAGPVDVFGTYRIACRRGWWPWAPLLLTALGVPLLVLTLASDSTMVGVAGRVPFTLGLSALVGMPVARLHRTVIDSAGITTSGVAGGGRIAWEELAEVRLPGRGGGPLVAVATDRRRLRILSLPDPVAHRLQDWAAHDPHRDLP